MIIKYSIADGSIIDVFRAHDDRDVSDNDTAALLVLPFKESAFYNLTPNHLVNAGNLEFNGTPLFTLDELKEYYLGLLDALLLAKVNYFGFVQLNRFQVLQAQIDRGATIQYPLTFYHPVTGVAVVANNQTGFTNAYGIVLGLTETNLKNRLSQFNDRFLQIINAASASEFTGGLEWLT